MKIKIEITVEIKIKIIDIKIKIVINQCFINQPRYAYFHCSWSVSEIFHVTLQYYFPRPVRLHFHIQPSISIFKSFL